MHGGSEVNIPGFDGLPPPAANVFGIPGFDAWRWESLPFNFVSQELADSGVKGGGDAGPRRSITKAGGSAAGDRRNIFVSGGIWRGGVVQHRRCPNFDTRRGIRRVKLTGDPSNV